MKKIVVIDDCRFTQMVVRDILEGAGYMVCSAESGIDANRHVFANPRPNLLLMDVEMPLLKGDQAVRFFRERESTRTIPILLMSSKTRDELAQLVSDSGADGYLQKPLVAETLLARVASLV